MAIVRTNYMFDGSHNRYGNWISALPGDGETDWELHISFKPDNPQHERAIKKYTAEDDEAMLVLIRQLGFTGSFRYE
jgi:hypothetical protein